MNQTFRNTLEPTKDSPVLGGGRACEPLEGIGQVTLIVESNSQSNFVYGQVRSAHFLTGTLNAQSADVVAHCAAKSPTKLAREIDGVNV